MLPAPNFDLGAPSLWNSLLVNTITFLLPLLLAVATFAVNRYKEKRLRRSRQIELLDLIKEELEENQSWVADVRTSLDDYQKWVESALQSGNHLPGTSLPSVVSLPHSGVWESVQVELASLDRSNHNPIPIPTATIVRSYSSYAEAERQLETIDQLIISAVQARASRGLAVKLKSAGLVYEMIRGLIVPLSDKLNEAEEQGKKVLGKLRKNVN